MPRIFTTLKAKDETLSPEEQIRLARKTRLKVQNILAGQHFSGNYAPNTIQNTAISISHILEEIARNISKMDQNLYSTKANMEEILRTNNSSNEFVTLN